MPCYHPISAWRSPAGVFFHIKPDCSPIQLPCGRCIGCRLERSRQWAVRLMHENRFHSSSCFITLTFSDENLPDRGSLNVKHFQDFMKRLRKKISPRKIRFFHCGEYGDKFGRPHYHAILFGEDFSSSKYCVRKTDRGDVVYNSTVLDELWPFGISEIGEVTFESCAYVARYVCKKVTGSRSASHYQRLCEATGEIFQVEPEYCTMSRRPGIGALHFDKYSNEIYLRDEVLSRGYPSKPPKFYDRLLAKRNLSLYEEIKDHRECALMMTSSAERSPSRLHVREVVKKAQIGLVKRNYESNS